MQYTTEELQTTLDLHKKWLYNKEEGKRANLRGADMSDANMSGAKNIPEIACFITRAEAENY